MNNNPNEPRKDSDHPTSAGAGEERKGEAASTMGQRDRGAESIVLPFRVDHTPPPLLIGEGSLIIETDRDFNSRDTGGGAAHRNRHIFNGGRQIMGLKILDDAGDTIYLNGAASGCSVKIWWKDPLMNPEEQIFVDGSTFTVETDQPLNASVPTGHSLPKRERRHFHPNAAANGIVQVAVVRGMQTVFFENRRLAQVMIWDTRD